jgi:histidine ammonia-lyase
MTDNPTFVFPEERPPHGAVLSNGSYHNALAAPMINSFARAWADLAQLAAHQVQRLVEAPEGLLATEADSRLTSLYMTQTGWAEEARQAAQPTLISLGGVGPTEASSPGLLAWRLANEAGGALDVCLATLAIVAGHTIEQAGRRAPRRLADLLDLVLTSLPPGSDDPGAQAVGLARLRDAFGPFGEGAVRRAASD